MILQLKNTAKTVWYILTDAGVVALASVIPPKDGGEMSLDVSPGEERFIYGTTVTSAGSQVDRYYRVSSTHGMKNLTDAEITQYFGSDAVAPPPPVVPVEKKSKPVTASTEPPVKKKRPAKPDKPAVKSPKQPVKVDKPLAKSLVAGRKIVLKMRRVPTGVQ